MFENVICGIHDVISVFLGGCGRKLEACAGTKFLLWGQILVLFVSELRRGEIFWLVSCFILLFEFKKRDFWNLTNFGV